MASTEEFWPSVVLCLGANFFYHTDSVLTRTGLNKIKIKVDWPVAKDPYVHFQSYR